MIRWEKKKLVFTPSGEGGWMHSHAQVPTALVMPDRIRVFFAARPRQDLSLPACLDLDGTDPGRVLSVHPQSLMDVGVPGSFDQHGVMPSCVIEEQGQLWMYYSGWCREVDVPYNNTIGLAVSNDGGKHFERMFEGPILGRSRHDPFNASSPFVMKEDGKWHMWYSSGTGFYEHDGKYEPLYLLRHATSENGIDWTPGERHIIPPLSPYEAQTRPTVLHRDGVFHMWYCYRGSEDYRNGRDSYRIGYARSENGSEWQRDDEESGISISRSGWDSAMIGYPYVVTLANSKLAMFYNGNDFGREGFGWAIEK